MSEKIKVVAFDMGITEAKKISLEDFKAAEYENDQTMFVTDHMYSADTESPFGYALQLMWRAAKEFNSEWVVQEITDMYLNGVKAAYNAKMKQIQGKTH